MDKTAVSSEMDDQRISMVLVLEWQHRTLATVGGRGINWDMKFNCIGIRIRHKLGYEVQLHGDRNMKKDKGEGVV